jgi:antirestriction protein ArdC
METNTIGKIACATMSAASLFLMSACTIAPYHRLESEAFFVPENNISQLAANDSFNQCNEQTRLLKHEIALCWAVPLIKVPLQ